MNIKIKGRYFTKSDRVLILDLATWCVEKLIQKDIHLTLDIVIHLVGKTIIEEDAHYATARVADDNTTTPPTKFLITISNKFKTLRTLILLAHEIVHVKQHANGELLYGDEGCPDYWMGQLVDDTKVVYWDLPWEIEAHGREKGLLYQWAAERNFGHSGADAWYKEIF